MTAAKIKMSVLAPDEANCFHITFNVEWTGWNQLQLEKRVFGKAGTPAWDKIKSIRLDGKEGFAPPTVLHADNVEWTDESPRWDVGWGEWLVDCLYSRTFCRGSQWRVREADSAGGKLGRRWNSMGLHRTRKRSQSVTIWRPFNLDISDAQAVRVQASLPTHASFGVSAEIDGELVEIAKPERGQDNWAEYRGEVSGRRLTALHLHCGDSELLKRNSPKSLDYHFHFVTLEKKGFAPPSYPKPGASRKPLPQQIDIPESLLDKGVPHWIYFDRSDVPRLREKIKSGPPAQILADVRARADRLLGYDPEPYIDHFYPTKSHEWYRSWTPTEPWADAMRSCAFMYVLTGDERYAEQAKRVLLAMARTKHWNYGMVSRFPVGWGGHGAPFCEATHGSIAALAYNWVYNVLTPDERRQVEDAILWKGWFWLNDGVDTRGYIRGMNQGPWFNYGALVTAMAVEHRYPFVREQYAKYEANFRESIGLCYYQDGANTEGAGYWGATTNYVVCALPLLAHVMGKDLKSYVPEPLAKSIDMPIYMRSMASQDWRTLAVNDGNYAPWRPGHIALFFASLLDLPRAQWAWQEAALKPGYHRDPVLSIIWYRDWGTMPRPELSLAKRFRGVDWAILRSGWEQGDILFALQSGVWGSGHQHPDKNSFILEAYGERLLPDKGVPTYGSPRGPFFQRTISHNTITIDGENQTRANAKIVRFEHNDRFDLVESDAARNYHKASRALRRVLFVRPRPKLRGYFIIADEIVLARPGVVGYNLHSFCDIEIAGDTLTFTGTKADLIVKVVAPSVFGQRFDQTRRSPREPTVHDVQLHTGKPVRESVFLTVLYPLPKGEEPPAITYERTATGAGLRVRSDVVRWSDDKGFDTSRLEAREEAK